MNLNITHLQNEYRSGRLFPSQLITELDSMMDVSDTHHIWIHRLNLAEMLSYAQKLEGKNPEDYPLYGIPFAIKDNIDLANIPTTAACAQFAYTPSISAFVIQKLINAGAIPIGKTNLDQFATGLVGARSPYGACKNSINPTYISGGSSAGSAVSVALNYVSFSLGTDTAGSGRVPAAFNHLIGMKPSLGLLSTSGVVPACKTLDCVSIFAKTITEAEIVFSIAQGHDEADDYSRPETTQGAMFDHQFKFGVPKKEQLAFFGNTETPLLFELAIKQLVKAGGMAVEIDFSPFLATARLLYEGPWVAERYAAIEAFIEQNSDALYPVTRKIINNAKNFSATDTFNAFYRLKALQRTTTKIWQKIDVLLTPTAGTIYTIDEVEADPIQTNSNLGYYTNFINLLDMAAIAIPAGFQQNGLPFGVTLSAPAMHDLALLNLAKRFNQN